jgi:hypothetical protein
MPSTTASIEVPFTVEQVWQLIGGFNSLPDWLPFIPHSQLSEGGRVRNLTTVDGQTIVERLQTFDEKTRCYSYSIVQATFPAKDYLATISVQNIVGKSASLVVWSGRFTPVGVSDEEVTELFHGIYLEGLTALKQSLASR